jgi:hypothetical protein
MKASRSPSGAEKSSRTATPLEEPLTRASGQENKVRVSDRRALGSSVRVVGLRFAPLNATPAVRPTSTPTTRAEINMSREEKRRGGATLIHPGAPFQRLAPLTERPLDDGVAFCALRGGTCARGPLPLTPRSPHKTSATVPGTGLRGNRGNWGAGGTASRIDHWPSIFPIHRLLSILEGRARTPGLFLCSRRAPAPRGGERGRARTRPIVRPWQIRRGPDFLATPAPKIFPVAQDSPLSPGATCAIFPDVCRVDTRSWSVTRREPRRPSGPYLWPAARP